MSSLDPRQFDHLILKLLENHISDKELEIVALYFSSDANTINHYCEFVKNYAALQMKLGNEISMAETNVQKEHGFDTDLWEQMLMSEKTAPAIELPKESLPRELIQKVVYPPREKREISRFNVGFVAMSAAAILFFFLFLRFAPPKGGVDVVTLTDSIHAKWAGHAASFQKGARMGTGSGKLLLREGYAELLFDNQAKVTIEGPAEFQILADDRIGLNYGKIYSQVPKEATGFSIYTRNSKIVDLGTEFGVEVDLRGETQLHVMQGKIKLISDQQSDTTSIEVREGEAKKISAAASTISPIAYETDLFVRKIDSKTDFIWRGQTKYNLADVVGGGDGFGKARLNFGIDHEGQTILLDNIVASLAPVPFTSVSSNPFVDGVFVPYGPTQIDSSKENVYDFGSTSGGFYLGILNGAWHKQKDNAVPRHALRLGGLEYGARERPAIYIHANQGITFDLQAIREYTQMEIDKFTSVCGMSETYGEYAEAIRQVRQFKNIKLPKASFYVLVDGREQFIRKEMTHRDEPVLISVDIDPQDRFLTLATTEGSDKNDGDWTLFGEPVLMLQND